MSKQKMKAGERKALLRGHMRKQFEIAGCELVDMKAGPQNYTAIRNPGSEFNIAAIYGSRKGASLWIKERVHNRLRDKYPEAYSQFVDVVDVDLFRRGFAWAVHFADPIEDEWLIDLVCTVSLQWGKREEARREAVEQAKQQERITKANREAEKRERMADKRKEWRDRKSIEASVEK